MLSRTSVRTTMPTYEHHSNARPIKPPHQHQQLLPISRCADNIHHGPLAVRSQECLILGRGHAAWMEWWLISSYAHRRMCYNKYNTISYNLHVSTDTHQSSLDETSSKTLWSQASTLSSFSLAIATSSWTSFSASDAINFKSSSFSIRVSHFSLVLWEHVVMALALTLTSGKTSLIRWTLFKSSPLTHHLDYQIWLK